MIVITPPPAQLTSGRERWWGDVGPEPAHITLNTRAAILNIRTGRHVQCALTSVTYPSSAHPVTVYTVT